MLRCPSCTHAAESLGRLRQHQIAAHLWVTCSSCGVHSARITRHARTVHGREPTVEESLEWWEVNGTLLSTTLYATAPVLFEWVER